MTAYYGRQVTTGPSRLGYVETARPQIRARSLTHHSPSRLFLRASARSGKSQLPRPIQWQAARGSLDRGLVGEHLLKMPFRVRQLGAKFKREREQATTLRSSQTPKI